MKKSSKICKKDEGVAIMLEDGGGIGFENKLWDNVTKRSMAKGGNTELNLPSDTEQLVKEGKVTYRGMGFGASGVKLKVKGKEYIVSDEKFKSLGGVSKIKFNAPFRQFGKGTTIEGSEVSLHLPVEMSVYVPSTKDANVPVSKSELSKRVNEVKEYLANLFGGYSSSQIIGGYASNEGSLIQEDVVKVISFATKKAYEENKQKLINKIASWSTAWSQEAIGFELEGDLYYINQDKKMGLGGALVLTGLGILGYMAFIKKGKKESKGSVEYRVDIYEKGKIRNTMIVKEFQIEGVKEDYDKLGYKTKFIKLEKLANGSNILPYNIEPSRYDFGRKNMSGEINELYIDGYNFKPTKAQVIKDLKAVKDRFRKGSEYAEFSPIVAIVYPYRYEWKKGYKILYLTNKEKSDRGFYDEINGARSVIELDGIKKMSKGGNTDCGCWHYEIGGL